MLLVHLFWDSHADSHNVSPGASAEAVSSDMQWSTAYVCACVIPRRKKNKCHHRATAFLVKETET